MIKIGIINYNMGNLGSLKRKIDLLGYESSIINNYKEIPHIDKLIFPGVGHFAKAVENLRSLNFWDELNELVLVKKKPILGICLGMQLMTKESEEGNVLGLGWFDGEVKRFQVSDRIKYKIPHIGWNTIDICNKNDVFDGISFNDEFYFVHSYHVIMNKESDILAKTIYDYPFVSAIARDNIFGFQFHPEKSHDIGRKILNNFIKL